MSQNKLLLVVSLELESTPANNRLRFFALSTRSCVTDLIFEGGMASCNATVMGAVLGCQTGYKMLPKKWIDGLPEIHKDWLNSKLNCLLNVMGLP